MSHTTVDSSKKSFEMGVTSFNTDGKDFEFPPQNTKIVNPNLEETVEISVGNGTMKGDILYTNNGEKLSITNGAKKLANNRKSAEKSERYQKNMVHSKKAQETERV